MLLLSDRLMQLKKSGSYSDADARGLALSNCRLTCFAAIMVLNILVMGEEGRMSGDDFKKLVGMTSGTAQDASEILEKNQRLGFVLIFQFQIENLLANLYREIKKLQPPKGFYNVAKEMLALIPQNDQSKLDTLNVPALIRNSLHSNGIHHGHKGSSSKLTIDGFIFEFNNLQKVSCAGWGHIVLACNAAISIVEEILNCSSVSALKDPILDQYAWEEATKP